MRSHQRFGIIGLTSTNAATMSDEPNESLGRTTIEPHVVVRIVGLVVDEIDGVARDTGNGSSRDAGIQAVVANSEVTLDVRVIARHGLSIATTTDTLRRRIAERVEAMTGLNIVELNISVVDISFADENEQDVIMTALRSRPH